MAPKEALLLLIGVMDQGATFVIILTTQVTWHTLSLQRPRLGLLVPQNKGPNMRGPVHLIGIRSMDLVSQDWVHKRHLHCKQASQAKPIQVLVVWTSLVCQWDIDTNVYASC